MNENKTLNNEELNEVTGGVCQTNCQIAWGDFGACHTQIALGYCCDTNCPSYKYSKSFQG